MGAVTLDDWVGIAYQLPGGAKFDGRFNCMAIITEVLNHAKNSSDCKNALLFWKRYVAAARQAPELDLWQKIIWGPPNQSDVMPRDELSEIHLEWASNLRQKIGLVCRPVPADKDANRRLKIGYLSPDFRTHPVAFFIEPFLRHHRRSEVEVTCYACSSEEDTYTARLRDLSDEWVSLAGMTAETAAARIRADEIDIAIDLAGHHVVRSLDTVAPVDVLAHYAAPVQVTWIGYPNTTGLDCVHYRLSDAVADPPHSTQKYSEELIRLPDCFLCFSPPQDLLSTPVGSSLPCETCGHVTFGSMNDLSKISPAVMRLWLEILLLLPSAVLKIKVKSAGKYSIREDNFDQYKELLVSSALDPSMPGFSFKSKANLKKRIEMVAPNPHVKDHFAGYTSLDIALDTLPYSGTTTTCDSLIMGVPVVTLRESGPDARHAHNVTASILVQAGLEELIADSPKEYVEKAVELAKNTENLRMLRASLRQRILSSPLCDGVSAAPKVESAFRTMWKRFCSGDK